MKSYGTYAVAEKFVRPLVNGLGGYAVGGAENLRAVDGEGYFATPSHRSNWDHFVLGLAMLDLPDLSRDQGPDLSQEEEPDSKPLQPRGLHWMAKDSLWRYPVVEQFVVLCNAFPVKRGTGQGLPQYLVEHIDNLMANNAVVVVYPESHRERGPEDEVKVVRSKLKSTVARQALKEGKPIVPVGLAGPVRGPKFPRAVVFEPPIFNEKMDPEDPGFESAKHALMDEVYAGMNSGYQKARELQAQLDPELNLIRTLNELTSSPIGKLAAGALTGLTWKFAQEIMHREGRE